MKDSSPKVKGMLGRFHVNVTGRWLGERIGPPIPMGNRGHELICINGTTKTYRSGYLGGGERYLDHDRKSCWNPNEWLLAQPEIKYIKLPILRLHGSREELTNREWLRDMLKISRCHNLELWKSGESTIPNPNADAYCSHILSS